MKVRGPKKPNPALLLLMFAIILLVPWMISLIVDLVVLFIGG